MKISSQEEYGIRCLLQIGRAGPEASLTIPEISRAEGLSAHYAAKLLRILRRGGLVRSVRGQAGGYRLVRPLGQISVAEALSVLGGSLYDPEFCQQHVGGTDTCTHSIDCTIRTLWRDVQQAVDRVVAGTTLDDLLPKQEAPPGTAPLSQLTQIQVN